MNNLNSLLNQQQVSSSQEIHDYGNFNDGFPEQMLSSVPYSAVSFPWADDQPSALLGPFGDQSSAALGPNMRQHQISNVAKAVMLQQQLLLSRSFADVNDLLLPTGVDAGLLPMPQGGHNDVVECPSAISENDSSTKALLNGFIGSLGQTPNQPQHFHLNGGALQADSFGIPPAVGCSGDSFGIPPAAGCSDGGWVAGRPRQKVRARRGQATDPHSIAERLRRERIAEGMKALQELVPNANKTDKASVLDEIIDYVKFLRLQVKVLSMSRLGVAPDVGPQLGDTSSQGKGGDGAEKASSSQSNEGMTVAEQQVAKLMEEDMGAAMQYLQGKGLCIMPISLATAISTAPSQSRKSIPPPNNPLLNSVPGGFASPSMSVLTVQSSSMKDTTSISNP